MRPIEGLASELKHLIKRNANVSTQHIGRDSIYPTSANSPEMVYTTLYTTDVPSRKRAVDQDDIVPELGGYLWKTCDLITDMEFGSWDGPHGFSD